MTFTAPTRDELRTALLHDKSFVGPSEAFDHETALDAYLDQLFQAADAESLWLNAFSCIRPTDAFAAEVGRAVIDMVMRHPERQVVVRVRAS